MSSRSVLQCIQLTGITMNLLFGIMMLIVLPTKVLKFDHKLSKSLFLVLYIGFLHESFASISWLKSTFQFYVISSFVLDCYTFPVACFILTVGVVFMTELSKKEFRRRTFVYGVYISMILPLAIGVGVVNRLSSQHDNAEFYKSDFSFIDDEVKQTDLSYENILTRLVTVWKCNSLFVCCVLEYALVYAPVSLILLWNDKKCVSSRQQDQHHQQCMTCDNNIMVQRYILVLMMFVIWLLRPISWIINFRYSFLSQDIIPSITMFIVYISILWHFLQQGIFKNDYLHNDSCNHKINEFLEPEKQNLVKPIFTSTL